MAYWLLKTEPSEYSFGDLLREKRTMWSGVRNALALQHIRKMRKGDAVLIYHTGDEKQIVGIAEVASDPYPDPQADDPRIVVVDLKPKRKLATPIPLAQIKADPRFKELALVRISRLSVMPVEKTLWNALLMMAG
ncbi:MAG TPA: EVE domain-containing protein [Phycisphaerae bacterium]|jgi:predicted RNA-binding protein with PUA-like domain